MDTNLPPGLTRNKRLNGKSYVRVCTIDLSERDAKLIAKRIEKSGFRTSEFARQALLEKARRLR